MTDTWYLPPAKVPPDTEWTATRAGGHALVLEYAPGHALVAEYGDCEFYLECRCGWTVCLGLRPDRPWSPELDRWVAHRDAGRRTVYAHCQCGKPFGSSSFAHQLTEQWVDAVSRNWERHTMTEVRET